MTFQHAGEFCMLRKDTCLHPPDAALGVRLIACHLLGIPVHELFRFAPPRTASVLWRTPNLLCCAATSGAINADAACYDCASSVCMQFMPNVHVQCDCMIPLVLVLAPHHLQLCSCDKTPSRSCMAGCCLSRKPAFSPSRMCYQCWPQSSRARAPQTCLRANAWRL